MNKEIFKGHWHEAKGKMKQQWGDLTDDEITKVNGSYEELQGLLEQKYGYQKERSEKEIDSFMDENGWKAE